MNQHHPLKWVSFRSAATREGLPIATMAGRFLREFKSIAERHPKLKLIIDHCGLVRAEQDAAAFTNLDELLSLAKLPNVAIKATGAPGYSTHAYPFRNLHDGLHRIFDAHGPKRFFWGTSQPVLTFESVKWIMQCNTYAQECCNHDR